MIDKDNKSRKGFVTEEDIATLLQKYEANTVLTLLQEVARYAGRTIDWDALVKKTSTGITNAREYQMLWRHLAYRDSLFPVEDGTQPLDDDSDLEYEVEAFPRVTHDASVEAAAHVKVMISSYLPNESSISDNTTVEAPLTINIPNNPSCRSSREQASPHMSTRGLNITVPVSLQKQLLPTIPSTEGVNGNGSPSGSMASRKRRKKWTSDEDQELLAAVEKCGEGNWANILKGDFKGDRTASQLSQRWAIIRKKRDTSTAGPSQSGFQRNEVQIAANHALSLAVGNRPSTKNITAGMSLNSTFGKIGEAPAGSSSGLQLENLSQPKPVQTSSLTSSVPKPQGFAKKTFVNRFTKQNPMVTANAVAAAACMSGPSGTPWTAAAEPGKHSSSAAPHAQAQSAGASAKPRVAEGTGAVSKPVQHVPSTSGLAKKLKVTNTEEAKLSDLDNTLKEQAQDKTASTNPEKDSDKQITKLGENSDPSSLGKNVDVKTEAVGVGDEVSKESRKTVENGKMVLPDNGRDNQSEAKEKVNGQGIEMIVKADASRGS